MPDPIADLSYRGYAGSHLSEGSRWLVIAKLGWRAAFKKRAFWVFSTLAAWYYFVMIAFLYVLEQMGIAQRGPEFLADQIFGRMKWKDQFLIGFTYAQLFWLSLILMVGAGAIANDNGTKALLVVLSKPCRKIDYLIGKWMGVLVPVWVGMAVPTMVFYLYGLMNFREYGFLSQEPWLGLRLLAMITGAAVFQSSLMLGVSSLFDKGRMAGAAYSAAFFLFSFFTNLMFVAWVVSFGGRREHQSNTALGQMAEKMYYWSIDGLQIGWAKVCLGTDGSKPFGAGAARSPEIHAPPIAMVLIPMVVLSALGLWLAWKRIRAVEVVK